MQPKGRVHERSRGVAAPPPRPGGFPLPRPAGDAGLPPPEVVAPPAPADGVAARRPIDDVAIPKPVEGVAIPKPVEGIAPSGAAVAKPARSELVAELVTASLLLALGGVVLVASAEMGIGWGSDGPESGFVPFWLATILVGSCGTVVVRALRRPSEKRFVTPEQLGRVLTVLLPATAMILLVPALGLYVASALYMSSYMRFGGRHGWATSTALPLAFVVLIFLVFERWFLVPLPKGPLEAWLGY